MTLLISSPKDTSTIRNELMRGAIVAMVRADAKAKAKQKKMLSSDVAGEILQYSG